MQWRQHKFAGCFSGGPAGASEVNIDEYMEKLEKLSAENKNISVVKQARDILNKVELPINWFFLQ